MGPVQAAGADAREVGDEHVVFALVLDTAEQRAEQGVVLDDHRRALEVVVVHHQVDPIARHQGGERLPAGGIVRLVLLEQFQAVEQVLLHPVQPGAEFDRILDLFFQIDADFAQFAVDERPHHPAAQGGQRLVERLFKRPDPLQVAVDLSEQFLFHAGDVGPPLLGQGEHFVLGHDPPFGAAQGEQQSAGITVQGEIARFRKRVEFAEGPGLLFFEGFFQPLALHLGVGGVQLLRDLRQQGLDQTRHALAQQAALAGGQAQGAGTLRRVEMVEVAEIRRGGPAGRSLLHGLTEQGGTATADLAQHEQVVVRLGHLQAEVHRGFRPFLTDPGQGLVLQGRGVGKPQGIGVDGQAQGLGGQSAGGHGRIRAEMRFGWRSRRVGPERWPGGRQVRPSDLQNSRLEVNSFSPGRCVGEARSPSVLA